MPVFDDDAEPADDVHWHSVEGSALAAIFRITLVFDDGASLEDVLDVADGKSIFSGFCEGMIALIEADGAEFG